MRNLLEFIVLHLVQHPEEVSVTETEEDGRFVYTIHVHEEDRGQVIGRRGRTIESIRTLARVRAMKEDVGIRIQMSDEADSADPDETDRDEADLDQ